MYRVVAAVAVVAVVVVLVVVSCYAYDMSCRFLVRVCCLYVYRRYNFLYHS